MSAARVLPISDIPAPFPTGIKGNFVKTRPSDLAVLSGMDGCQAACYCFIFLNTAGWQIDRSKGEKLKDFATFTNYTQRACQDAIDFLMDGGFCGRKKVDDGYSYWLIKPIDVDGEEAIGECGHCKEITQYTADRSVPIPKALFSEVLRAVDHGTQMVLLLFSLECFAWKNGEIWVIPKEFKIDKIRHRVGLEKSEVEADIKTAESLGFSGSAGKRGAVQTFWPTPANWKNATPRPKRKGGNPNAGRKRTKLEPTTVPIVKPPETTRQPAIGSPVEFRYGTCHKCGQWAPFRPVADSEKPVKKPFARDRAGPIPQPLSKLPTFERDPWLKNG
jgi:hypothetical protein